MKKSQSFFSLFKSPKNSENEVESNKQVHKHYIASSKCNNSRNKSKMEREWTKACGQMDKRAQLLQVFFVNSLLDINKCLCYISGCFKGS